MIGKLKPYTFSFQNRFGYDSNILTSHPPDEVRLSYITEIQENIFMGMVRPDIWGKLGNDLITNLNTLWDELLPILYQIQENDNTIAKPTIARKSSDFEITEKDSLLLDTTLKELTKNKDSIDPYNVISKLVDKLAEQEELRLENDENERNGISEWRNENFQEAIDWLLKAEQENSSSFNVYFFLGRSYASLGNDEKAIEYFTKAEKFMEYHWVYNNRGNSLRRIKKYDEALKDLNKAIKLKPNVGLQYINRGLINFEIERFSEAEIDYKRGIRLEPNVPYYYNQLAEVLCLDGNYEEISKFENRFLNSNPNTTDRAIFNFFFKTSYIINEIHPKNLVKPDLDWDFVPFYKYVQKTQPKKNEEKIKKMLQSLNKND